MKEIFEPARLFMNNLPPSFIWEVLFRCVVVYLSLIIVLKLSGRRGIKQLSIFEVVIILTLGSAAGDPLFYEDVGLLPAICVFIFILVLYRITTYSISKSKRIEKLLEGEPVYLIENGEFAIDKFKKESMAFDEFFAELRLRNISHLGQVDLAILETTGEISVFYLDNDKIKYGLPILPHHFNNKVNKLNKNDIYACRFCGNIQKPKETVENCTCDKCGREDWVKAINDKRVS
ncbi:hypothetical protein A5893_11415 [Pedobacter psychrophilus]|uniref:YetF C-terminal domain-containing protein n=1 Tax=Pedobacter psychrophilus TaxID=1826909 RepID=A0A179DDY3_9SPHI|nr:DUF421 domain-containing protein [Pedobacter psychrophilus]OAQ39267.1 hypothetical protein A5893_11415 [Pedobacter psychrophilus]